jgi:hypothetical protein
VLPLKSAGQACSLRNPMIHDYFKPLNSPSRSRPIIKAVGLGLVLASTFLLQSAGHGQSNRRTITLKNNSDRTITEFYMSHIRDGFWGPNQLASPLQPGQTFRRGDVAGAQYDLKYIDGSGRSCIQLNMPIVNDLVIELTNESLAKCQSDSRP